LIEQRVNPIILREMRSRMRGVRIFIGLTGYLLLLSGIAGLIYAIAYYANAEAYSASTLGVQYGPLIGKSLFVGITFFLLFIFPFIAPSLGADAIAGEKERQTYEMLIITPLKARQIVWGKLGAVLMAVLLLMLAALPVQSLAFSFGGVALIDMLIAMVGLFVTAFVTGALGIYISSLVKSAKVANALANILVGAFIYLLPALIFVIATFASFFLSDILEETGLIIPLLLIYVGGFLVSINPFGAAILTGVVAAQGNGYFFFSWTESIPSGQTFTLWLVSPWLVYVIFHTLLAWGLISLTIRRVARISNN
jgi:ABC-type transport system involved in multi-copper enzyme maturation permease subunit